MNHSDQNAHPQHKPSRMGFSQRAAIIIPVLILFALTVTRLPQGICFGDSGGLQLAAATNGITHPPGYVVYTSILHALAWVLPFAPAYDVSLSCLASGLGVVALCTLIQIRLGVSVWFAATTSLLFTAHPRVWSNCLAPEVYMPTLWFEVLTIYWLMQFSATGRQRSLYLASLSLGIALANRPPVIFFLPFALFVVAKVFIHNKGTIHFSRRTVALAMTAFLVPIFYAPVYILVRDTPDTSYNYIEQYNAEVHVVPASDAGFKAKCQRMFWLVSGAQFRSKMGNTWSGLKRKLRWVSHDMRRWLGAAGWKHGVILLAAWMVIMLSGGAFAWSQNKPAMVLLLGLAFQSIIFVCLYRIHGDAANTLPLLFTCSVLGGVAISKALNIFGEKLGHAVSVFVLCVSIIFTVWQVPHRSETGRAADATTFLRKFNLNSLAADSVICSMWETSTPLWYAKYVTSKRPDITVINASSSAWPRMTLSMRQRTIVVVESPTFWHKPDW